MQKLGIDLIAALSTSVGRFDLLEDRGLGIVTSHPRWSGMEDFQFYNEDSLCITGMVGPPIVASCMKPSWANETDAQKPNLSEANSFQRNNLLQLQAKPQNPHTGKVQNRTDHPRRCL